MTVMADDGIGGELLPSTFTLDGMSQEMAFDMVLICLGPVVMDSIMVFWPPCTDLHPTELTLRHIDAGDDVDPILMMRLN